MLNYLICFNNPITLFTLLIQMLCNICKEHNFDEDEVTKLRCQHTFCLLCIEKYIKSNLKPKMKCPVNNCKIHLSDYVIRKVSDVDTVEKYEHMSITSVTKAENKVFSCLLKECSNVIYYDNDIQFECQKCGLYNCTKCKSPHAFMSCSQYQSRKKSDIIFNRRIDREIAEQFEAARVKLNRIEREKCSEELKLLESQELIPSNIVFNCEICFKIIDKQNGVVLRRCQHNICKICLKSTITNSNSGCPECPRIDCSKKIEDREISAILNDEEQLRFNLRSLEVAKKYLDFTFHCKTPDCYYFVEIADKNVDKMYCPKCNKINCLKCNCIHKPGEVCRLTLVETDLKTKKYIENEIKAGNLMKCPTCSGLVSKISGCNWIQCPNCKLELCWILKIPRWGPKGRGDTSGGCRCGVNDVLCSPDCRWGCQPE